MHFNENRFLGTFRGHSKRPKSVNTNIEREFLSLIDKHFPPQHKLYTQDFQQKHFKNKL